MTGRIQHIHLYRDDPVAAGKIQVWRGWTAHTEPGKGSVFIEEGTLGGTTKRTEIGASLINGDPTDYLQSLILDKPGGWTVSLLSEEMRIASDRVGQRLFQFNAITKMDRGKKAQQLMQALDLLRDEGGEESIEWLDTKTLEALVKEPATGFRAPVQIGRDTCEIRVMGNRNTVLSADVRIGSLAETLLLMLAATQRDGMHITVTDENAKAIASPIQHLRDNPMNLPDWVRELGYRAGVFARGLRFTSASAQPMPMVLL